MVLPTVIPSRTIVVIGGGLGGLTAAALLARRGCTVKLFDQALKPGGCASTFQRRGFTFDVGATQVAGLEPGGIHQRIFSELELELPAATPCDPACAVYLPGESEPISVWRDPQRWRAERQRQFSGSEPFWQLLQTLFQASWRFQSRDPVLPPRNLWDLGQLLQALRPDTLTTFPFAFWTVGDALRVCGLGDQARLRTFLDLQLKLYSQVEAEETALLYAATALGLSQAPHGLYHLHGSMQVLSDRLVRALKRDGGQVALRHTVEQIHYAGGRVRGVTVRSQKTGQAWQESADAIVANVSVHNLVQLLPTALEDLRQGWPRPAVLHQHPLAWAGWSAYRRRVEKLPNPSGAFVVYLGVTQAAIPEGCPPHLQFLYDAAGELGENNTLFVSVSQPGDGRAPAGRATIIASTFVDTRPWWQGQAYEQRKQDYTEGAIARLSQFFHLTPDTLLHVEAATPRTFARFTGREQGFVGGIGQRVSTFGPFGFATRTPVPGLWLVGDSVHPGEGTAGVSYGALTAVRQLLAG